MLASSAPASGAVDEATPERPIVNAAPKPSAIVPVTWTTFVACAAEVRTLSVSSVVGSVFGERLQYGAAPESTVSLSASEKKIWVV